MTKIPRKGWRWAKYKCKCGHVTTHNMRDAHISAKHAQEYREFKATEGENPMTEFIDKMFTLLPKEQAKDG